MSCNWPGSLSLPEAQGCPLVQYLPVGNKHCHVIPLGRALSCKTNSILMMFFLANISEKNKKKAWWLCEVWFIMQCSMREKCVNSYAVLSFFPRRRVWCEKQRPLCLWIPPLWIPALITGPSLPANSTLTSHRISCNTLRTFVAEYH